MFRRHVLRNPKVVKFTGFMNTLLKPIHSKLTTHPTVVKIDNLITGKTKLSEFQNNVFIVSIYMNTAFTLSLGALLFNECNNMYNDHPYMDEEEREENNKEVEAYLKTRKKHEMVCFGLMLNPLSLGIVSIIGFPSGLSYIIKSFSHSIFVKYKLIDLIKNQNGKSESP